jgi:hypothetical protein
MDQQKQIEELERVLLSLEQAADLCGRRLLRQEEAAKVLAEAHQSVLVLLPRDSTAHRLYDRTTREAASWTRTSRSGYAESEDCKKIEERIALIRRVVNELEPEFLRDEHRDKDQFYFIEGDSYRPKKQVFGVMKKAITSLAVVDPYLDDQVFDYIESLDPVLSMQLLTGKKKPIFQSLFKSLKAQRSNLEAKAFSGCHDRFIVIDGSEVWHLGASINGFGKAAFMVNKVVDDAERTRFLTDLSEWWRNGEDLSV